MNAERAVSWSRRVWVLGVTMLVSSSMCASELPLVRRLDAANPTSALFIGNSFFYHNNGINEHLLKLIRSIDPDGQFRVTAVTISGAGLDWHDVESYFRSDGIGRYSFDASNNIHFNKLSKRPFDVTVMMDCSQCPVFAPLQKAFFTSVAKNSVIVRRHGAAPVLFMSWAYQDRPEMTQQLADAYTTAGNQNHALVIPAGLAFAEVGTVHPEINLYDADKRHPSLAGTYLATCVTYATLFGRSPDEAKYDGGLEEDTAHILQTAAWRTVREYLGPELAPVPK